MSNKAVNSVWMKLQNSTDEALLAMNDQRQLGWWSTTRSALRGWLIRRILRRGCSIDTLSKMMKRGELYYVTAQS